LFLFFSFDLPLFALVFPILLFHKLKAQSSQPERPSMANPAEAKEKTSPKKSNRISPSFFAIDR